MQKGSINKVVLIGRIGANPEGRYTSSGISTAWRNMKHNLSEPNKKYFYI